MELLGWKAAEETKEGNWSLFSQGYHGCLHGKPLGLGSAQLKYKYPLHSSKFLLWNPKCSDLMEEPEKEQRNLRGDEDALPPPALPLHMPRGVWRISSEKWYCKLYRGRNWVSPRMKSNCIVNTSSFSFHLSPFCYFLFLFLIFIPS